MERQFVQVDQFSHTHFMLDNKPLYTSRHGVAADAEPDGSLHPDKLEDMLKLLRDSVQLAQLPVAFRTVEYTLTHVGSQWIMESYF